MEKNVKTVKKEQSSIIKSYLFLYNSFEAVGWSLLLLCLLKYYAFGDDKQPLFEQVKWLVLIFPNSAVLEIFHALTGMVASSALVTAIQVYSRILVVCGAILPTLAARESIGFTIALFSWSFSEAIRYSFYALNLINSVPYFITWLRYSIFIIIFPLGLFGETLVLYCAQEEFGKTGLWSIRLPNTLNMTFDFQYFLVGGMTIFISGFFTLYSHMLAQRRKVLSGLETEKKSH